MPANREDQAKLNWQRYEYGRMRGHQSYCRVARECENFYLGGGRQWDPDDRQKLEEEGRPALEFNQIKPKLNSAIGYQIQNRMDIAFRPRGNGADDELAKVLSKVTKQVADNTSLHREIAIKAAHPLGRQSLEVVLRRHDPINGRVDIDPSGGSGLVADDHVVRLLDSLPEGEGLIGAGERCFSFADQAKVGGEVDVPVFRVHLSVDPGGVVKVAGVVR